MSQIPRGAAGRAARLASLPLGHAGRSAKGIGRRLTGTPSDVVNEEIQRRTAEQLFAVLGSLKGGAMKVGQALSVLEAALPEEYVEPYREMLVKLQDAAPPMSTEEVHGVLERDLGADWRREVDIEDTPVAAASIGQVHRGRTQDGRTVAVKIQYPGADKALRSDLRQIARLARVATTWMPAMDIKPLTEELLAAADEELDYHLESANQAVFAKAFAGHPRFAVPQVVHTTRHVIVSDWLEGASLSQVIREGDQDLRNRVGEMYLEFMLLGPRETGLMHADPHPGNFRLTPDGRLGVIDYGAVARLPKGIPDIVGTLARHTLAGDGEAVVAGMRAEGFILPGISVDPDELLAFVLPFVDPLRAETHDFTRAWLRHVSEGVTDLRDPRFSTGLRLNMPPDYGMIHRVFAGSTGVLCQLEATVHARDTMRRLLPGFAGD